MPGYIITMTELDIHGHPGDTQYYTMLVVNFAKICHMMHKEVFSCLGKRARPPVKVYIMFGPVTKGPFMLDLKTDSNIDSLFSCSLSASLPLLKGAKGTYLDAKEASQAIRAEALYRAIPDGRQAHANVAGQDDTHEPGNCAETGSMTTFVIHFSML